MAVENTDNVQHFDLWLVHEKTGAATKVRKRWNCDDAITYAEQVKVCKDGYVVVIWPSRSAPKITSFSYLRP
jgi:hypothetical protein